MGPCLAFVSPGARQKYLGRLG